MKLVIALGGNALGNSPKEQKKAVENTAESIVDLIENGHDVVLVHGNGPQVGMIHSAFEKSDIAMAFPECTAMSQGYIGHHLVNALKNKLAQRNISKQCAALLTHVIVDNNDEAFMNPTKPIGGFMTLEESEDLRLKKGWNFIEDSGRGYRRVVASPKPIQIVEQNLLLSLFQDGHILVVAGGGGIPVIEQGGMIQGVEAVIDKDFASALVAESIGADALVILTEVDEVAINFGQENQINLRDVTDEHMSKYIEEGQFGAGSMLPKVQAGLSFLDQNNEGYVMIGSLNKAGDTVSGISGTKITKKKDGVSNEIYKT